MPARPQGSWDITKLRGIWYALDVVLDVFSRYAVGCAWATERVGGGGLVLTEWCKTAQVE